jgi:hypothetical protein
MQRQWPGINLDEIALHQSFEDLAMDGLMPQCQGWHRAAGSLVSWVIQIFILNEQTGRTLSVLWLS